MCICIGYKINYCAEREVCASNSKSMVLRIVHVLYVYWIRNSHLFSRARKKKGFSFFSCVATPSRTVPKTQPLRIAFSLRERADLRSQKEGILGKKIARGRVRRTGQKRKRKKGCTKNPENSGLKTKECTCIFSCWDGTYFLNSPSLRKRPRQIWAPGVLEVSTMRVLSRPPLPQV